MDFLEIFTKIHSKFILFSQSFQAIFGIMLRHVFIQKCIRILVDTIILAVDLILWVKNANRVDPSEIKLFEAKKLNVSILFPFFTNKMGLTTKIIMSTRILMKFWVNPCLKHFFSYFCVCLLKLLGILKGKTWIFNVF